MKEELNDARLSELVRAARPATELPPGFQNAVWRRIEKADVRPVNVLEWVARWFATPRLATAAAVVVILLGASVGAVRGMQAGERQAKDRYVSSVDPSYTQR
jgi:hypothetical protein